MRNTLPFQMIGKLKSRIGDRVARWFARPDSADLPRTGFEQLEPRALLSGESFTFVVTVTSDSITLPQEGSLRWAIEQANLNPGLDTIYFDFSGVTESPGLSQTIFLDGAELLITDSVVITGNGSDLLTIDARGLSRVLLVEGAETVSISGMTIRGGALNNDSGAGIAIHETESVILSDMVITENTGQGLSEGVGLFSTSQSLSLVNSVVGGNTALGGGNGVGLSLHTHSSGYSDVTIFNSLVSGNSATITTSQTSGAGIWTGREVTLVLLNSVVADNVISLENGEVTTSIEGVGLSTRGHVSVIESRIVNNVFTSEVPGVYSHSAGIFSTSMLNLIRSEVSGNTVSSGPGAGIFAYGELNILQSTVAYNQTETTGLAAGIYYDGSDDAESQYAQIINSTIYGNTVGNDPSSTTTAGIYSRSYNPIRLANTIVAGNLVYFLGQSTPSDIAGVVESLSPNLIFAQGFGSILNPDQVILGVDPQLMPELRDNAGPTRTLAPLPGSPIIDVGDNFYGLLSETDQRGAMRILDGKLTGTPIIDLGAVEAAAALSGVIFSDLNQNGVRDIDEPGIFDVFVGFYSPGPDGQAYTSDDVEVGGIYTNALGEYKFDTLPPGDIYAKVDLISDAAYTVQNLTQPKGSRVVSNGPDAGTTPLYTLAGADVQPEVYAGFVVASPVSGEIRGAVFNDLNGNGIHETNEPTVQEAIVKAYAVGADGKAGTADDELIGEFLTGADGVYYFTSSVPVTAYIQIDPGSVGAAFITQQNLDMPHGNRADQYGNTPLYTIDPQVDNTGVMLGVLYAGKLEVYVQASNPVQDFPVMLSGILADGTAYSELLVSDSKGYVGFQGLRPGVYTIIPGGLVGYAINDIIVGSLGGDIIAENSAIDNINLSSGSTASGYQYDLAKDTAVTALAGIVFEDVNLNGVYDAGIDNPLPGVHIDIYKKVDRSASGGISTGITYGDYELVQNLTTGLDGTYSFAGLSSEESYKITQETASGYVLMKATPGTSGGQASPLSEMSIFNITPVEGQVSEGYAFANVKPNTVEGRLLMFDPDGGKASHKGIAGVTVMLKASNDAGGYDTFGAVTDADGYYAFADLLPAVYEVFVYEGVPSYLVIQEIIPGTGAGTADLSSVSISGIDLSSKTDFDASSNDFLYSYHELTQTVYIDAKSSVTYYDDRGNRVTLSMTGAGSGVVTFIGGSDITWGFTSSEVTQHKTVQSIVFTGTNAATTFRVDAVALDMQHPLQTVIPRIEVAGDIGTIYAPRASFANYVKITGGVANITFGDVVNDYPAYLNFTSSSAIKSTSLSFGVVRDLSINALDVKLSALQAVAWLDGESSPAYITAGSIDRMTMTGRGDMAGNFEADLFLTGKDIAETSPTLNLVNIAGAITNSNWDIQGNIERINTRSGGEAWNLQATGLLAYLNTTRSLIQTNIEVQSIGVLSIRQHLIDTLVMTGEGLPSSSSSIAGVNVGGTIIDSVIDSENTGVGTILVNGNISGFIMNVGELTRFNTGLSVYDSRVTASVIGSIFVSLDMMGSIVQATQPLQDGKTSIGRLTVYAVAYDSTFDSQGSIDAVRFGHLVDSRLYVGYGEGGFYQTESGQVSFINTLYLSSTIGYTDYKALENSYIYAGYISSTKIYSVNENSETSDYGLTLHKLTTYARRQDDGAVLTLKNLENSSATPQIADQAGAYKLRLVQVGSQSHDE